MATPTLIYCGGGNRRLYQIAVIEGFEYGSQLPDTIYGPLYFADQDWRNPDRERYMKALKASRPHMATVMDWEREEQLDEVLSWAEEAAQYVAKVIIVPKVIGGISQLPRRIAGKQVILGYSVPTRYAGTSVPLWSFQGWSVHLLGGSPQKQMELWRYLPTDIISADGNMMQKMAVRHCSFWVPGTGPNSRTRWWPTLQDVDGHSHGTDAPYEAFRRSCVNIMAAWQHQTG